MENAKQLLNSIKLTENGDIAFNTTGNNLLDILFMTEYYTKHPDEVKIGNSEREKLFSMFIRDPRYGLGRRDLGRKLMALSGVSLKNVVKAGRYDDIFFFDEWMEFLAEEIKNGNELAKKWAPRYSSKRLMLARDFAHFLGLNKQQYGKFVKAKTVERSLSTKNTGIIQFEHVPSLAMVKYYGRFSRGNDTAERFANYLADVKAGHKDLKVSTTTVYDIYRNRDKIDADLFFDKIEKIAVNCIPVIDSSGSMQNKNDSYGKAMAIGHYLAKCSTYAPNMVVSFSSHPRLMELNPNYGRDFQAYEGMSNYEREIRSMHTGDWSNTDFGAVMRLLGDLNKLPEYLVVLSDMEFDYGSRMTKDQVQSLWKSKGYTTKIVWWNLNERATTSPEIDEEGNIFMSGYNPMLLKFLEAGFDGQKFLNKLLDEYEKAVTVEK